MSQRTQQAYKLDQVWRSLIYSHSSDKIFSNIPPNLCLQLWRLKLLIAKNNHLSFNRNKKLPPDSLKGSTNCLAETWTIICYILPQGANGEFISVFLVQKVQNSHRPIEVFCFTRLAKIILKRMSQKWQVVAPKLHAVGAQQTKPLLHCCLFTFLSQWIISCKNNFNLPLTFTQFTALSISLTYCHSVWIITERTSQILYLTCFYS